MKDGEWRIEDGGERMVVRAGGREDERIGRDVVVVGVGGKGEKKGRREAEGGGCCGEIRTVRMSHSHWKYVRDWQHHLLRDDARTAHKTTTAAMTTMTAIITIATIITTNANTTTTTTTNNATFRPKLHAVVPKDLDVSGVQSNETCALARQALRFAGLAHKKDGWL